jgi:hypothetical protein
MIPVFERTKTARPLCPTLSSSATSRLVTFASTRTGMKEEGKQLFSQQSVLEKTKQNNTCILSRDAM